MNGISYFPGCSLKDNALRFETSARFVMEALGLPLIELDSWNCCGTVYSLTADDLMHHVASARNLVRTQEAGSDELVTLCAMCYNTLSRVADRLNTNTEDRDKINAFMNQEADYQGGVRILHLLPLLSQRIGWEKISGAVTRPLTGLRVACYYGCTLVRPKDIAVDSNEKPSIMDDALSAADAAPVPFPFAAECCGTYQIVDREEVALERSARILQSAYRAGAEVVAVACPLCQHNLARSAEVIGTAGQPGDLPVVYFTELLAAALGMRSEDLDPAARSAVERFVPVEGGSQNG